MGEHLKNIETFLAKKSAVPRGLLNRQRLRLDIEQRKIIQDKVDNHQRVVLLPVRLGIEEYREQSDIKVASLCEYHKLVEVDDTTVEVVFKCISRCSIEDFHLSELNYLVDINLIPEDTFDLQSAPYIATRVEAIQQQFKEYLKIDSSVAIAQIENVKHPRSVDHLIENIIVATKARFDMDAMHRLLRELLPANRLSILGSILETRIFQQEADKGKDLASYYSDKLDKLVIDTDIKKRIYLEFSRLKNLKVDSSEYGNVIDWLDRVLSFPWGKETKSTERIDTARSILDGSHYGLEKLKERIIDIVAIQQYTTEQPAQIICLYGPPGIGKSTIARSIADALGREYVALSLGGVKRSEDILGMKRFFIGAKPGKIVDGMIRAGSKNCVILLDEIDKLSTDGGLSDLGSVLLSVLDRNQNGAFRDDYFDIPVDLSKVFFIATANDLSMIPSPLRNRLEVISLDGYSINEKVDITRRYLIRKVLAEFGLVDNIISFSAETVAAMIEQYTLESGVRQLENVIRTIVRKHLAYKAASGFSLEPVELSIEDVNKMVQDFYDDDPSLAIEGEIGVVNKLSVVNGSMGLVGRLEAVIAERGKGKQIISDNIIGTALSTFKTVAGLLRYHAKEWGIPGEVFSDYDLYVHSPMEERRHDGSSGGVADVVCIVSAIKNIPVPHTTVFSGAITLKGKIIKIGGVKAKVLAAQRQGMKTVVLPASNKKDVDALSGDVVGNMEIKYFEDIDEVYKYIF